jgi:hypothetical protein
MTACFPALGNDDIDTRVYRASGIGRRTNGVHHDDPTRLCKWDQRRGIAPKEGNDRNALFEANCQAFFFPEETQGPD